MLRLKVESLEIYFSCLRARSKVITVYVRVLHRHRRVEIKNLKTRILVDREENKYQDLILGLGVPKWVEVPCALTKNCTVWFNIFKFYLKSNISKN